MQIDAASDLDDKLDRDAWWTTHRVHHSSPSKLHVGRVKPFLEIIPVSRDLYETAIYMYISARYVDEKIRSILLDKLRSN